MMNIANFLLISSHYPTTLEPLPHTKPDLDIPPMNFERVMCFAEREGIKLMGFLYLQLLNQNFQIVYILYIFYIAKFFHFGDLSNA